MPILLLFLLQIVTCDPPIGLIVATYGTISYIWLFLTCKLLKGLLVGGYGNSGQLSSVETLGLSSSCQLPSLPSPLKRHLTILTKDDQVKAV